jgi:putative redox protein
VWRRGLEFESGVDHRTHLIDGKSKSAPSPVETLLGAIGTCAGSDVVDILEKQRTPITALTVDVMGTRRAEHPRRLIALEVTFTLRADNVDVAQAERAIALSIEKYCTVAASLAGDVTFTSILVLNGAAQPPVQQAMFNARS